MALCYLGIVFAIAIRQISLRSPVILSFAEGDRAVIVHLAQGKLENAMIPAQGPNITRSSYITTKFGNSDKVT
jgi:hypothetical protein